MGAAVSVAASLSPVDITKVTAKVLGIVSAVLSALVLIALIVMTILYCEEVKKNGGFRDGPIVRRPERYTIGPSIRRPERYSRSPSILRPII
jgi:hypothetical protein